MISTGTAPATQAAHHPPPQAEGSGSHRTSGASRPACSRGEGGGACVWWGVCVCVGGGGLEGPRPKVTARWGAQSAPAAALGARCSNQRHRLDGGGAQLRPGHCRERPAYPPAAQHPCGASGCLVHPNASPRLPWAAAAAQSAASVAIEPRLHVTLSALTRDTACSVRAVHSGTAAATSQQSAAGRRRCQGGGSGRWGSSCGTMPGNSGPPAHKERGRWREQSTLGEWAGSCSKAHGLAAGLVALLHPHSWRAQPPPPNRALE